MSGIHNLIAKLCPSGVYFKRLGDIARIKNGKDHKSLADGKYPVYGSGGIMRYANSYAYDKPSVLIPRKGSLDNLFFVDTPFWNVDTIFYTEIDESQIYPKFFYYFLQTVGLGEMNQAGGVPSQTQSVLNEIKIPVPPIQIQAEIVRILDAMTAHTAELTAELTARKKQYNYYRDKLLSFEEGEVEWKELGEEFSFIRNGFVGTVTPFFTTRDKGVRYLQGTNINNGNIRDNVEYYVNLDFHEKHSRTHLKADDILLVQSGHVGDSAVVGEKYKGSNCHALIVISNAGRMNSKFVNYYFQSRQGKEQLRKITTGGTVKHILASKMKKFMIPVPSIEVQNHIVDLLDKFNALTTSITEGLPREIELRQKQYAYYRDLLLSFPQAQTA